MTYRLLPLILALLLTAEVPAQDVNLDEPLRDLAPLAAESKARHLPIVLTIGSEDCGYCMMLRSELLQPMADAGDLEGRVLLREMDRDARGKILDFEGESIRAPLFLDRYKVFATPTVLFLDHRGRPLHRPLVGYNGAEDYRPLLEEAIRESTALIAAGLGEMPSELAGTPNP